MNVVSFQRSKHIQPFDIFLDFHTKRAFFLEKVIEFLLLNVM